MINSMLRDSIMYLVSLQPEKLISNLKSKPAVCQLTIKVKNQLRNHKSPKKDALTTFLQPIGCF